jgi:hypothetical protein
LGVATVPFRSAATPAASVSGTSDALVVAELDDERTADGEDDPQQVNQADSEDGRYWARTSDPQLVELVLSQLS